MFPGGWHTFLSRGWGISQPGFFLEVIATLFYFISLLSPCLLVLFRHIKSDRLTLRTLEPQRCDVQLWFAGIPRLCTWPLTCSGHASYQIKTALMLFPWALYYSDIQGQFVCEHFVCVWMCASRASSRPWRSCVWIPQEHLFVNSSMTTFNTLTRRPPTTVV